MAGGGPLLPGAGAPAGAAPQEASRGAGPGFTWEAPPGLAGAARRFEAELGELIAEARSWAGVPADPRPLHVVWVADRGDLAAELGEEVPEWYAAVAVPAARRMIIATEAASSESRLRTTLRHEVMHLVLADMGLDANARLPAWFHEGCAEVFAGDVYLGGLGVSLAWRAFVGELERLDEYRDGFGREPYHAAVGYALGHAFVERLQRLHGQDALRAILARVMAGAALEEALIATTGASAVTHEEELRAQLASPLALAADFYPQFFLGLMLLLVAAFPLLRAARRRRRREMEERWAREERERYDPVTASGQWREGRQDPEARDADADELDWWETEW